MIFKVKVVETFQVVPFSLYSGRVWGLGFGMLDDARVAGVNFSAPGQWGVGDGVWGFGFGVCNLGWRV